MGFLTQRTMIKKFIEKARHHCTTWLLAVVLSILLPSSSSAGTVIFPDEYSNLQDAINAAAVGDTLLVKVGSHDVGNIALKSGILFTGETGSPEDVVFFNDHNSESYFSITDVDSTTTISGLTFDLSWRPIEVHNSGPLFRDCVFTASAHMWHTGMHLENSSSTFENCKAHGFQNGVLRIWHSSVLFSNCFFFDNNREMESISSGGVATIEYSSDAVFKECMFKRNHCGGPGSGCLYSRDSTVILDSCIVQDNSGEGLGAMYSNGSTTVINCIFNNNRAFGHSLHGGSRGYGGAVYSSGNAIFKNTLFLNNGASDAPFEDERGCGGAVLSRGVTNISSCLFYGNDAHYGSAFYGTANLDHCIFAFGFGGDPVYPSYHPTDPFTLSCCDIWGNESGDWTPLIVDQQGINGNFSGDPGFCNAEMGIFTLCADSPCLPGMLPGGCDELVGLYGAGCDDCDPLPDFLLEFTAEVKPDTVKIFWSVNEDTPVEDFRLTRLVDGSETPIHFLKQSPGQFKAEDVFDGSRYGEMATYNLSFKIFIETWTLLSSREISLEGVLAKRQLESVFPNPFNPMTSIALKLYWGQYVDLSVYDLQGRRVCILHDGYLGGGPQMFNWNGTDTSGKKVASGSYYIRLITEETVESQAVLLLK